MIELQNKKYPKDYLYRLATIDPRILNQDELTILHLFLDTFHTKLGTSIVRHNRNDSYHSPRTASRIK